MLEREIDQCHRPDALDASGARRPAHERRYVLRALSVDRRHAHRLRGRRRDRALRRAAGRTSRVAIDALGRAANRAALRDAAESLETTRPRPTARRWRSSRAATRTRCRSGKPPSASTAGISAAGAARSSGCTTANASRTSTTPPATNASRSSPSTRSAPPAYVTSAELGRITELVASPCGDRLAFANHRHELYVLDLGGEPRMLDTSKAWRCIDLAFSPDGRWLAYVWSPKASTSIVRIADCTDGTLIDVTDAAARRPLARLGSRRQVSLLHLGARFQPDLRRAAVRPELSARACGPFVATLRADVPNPFVPCRHRCMRPRMTTTTMTTTMRATKKPPKAPRNRRRRRSP